MKTILSFQENGDWAKDWRFAVAMFLLVIGICFLVVGMFVVYVNEIDGNSLVSDYENREISELKNSIEQQKLRSDGFGYIAIGIATVLGSTPFFERIASIKKQNEEFRTIIFPMLTKSHRYLEDMINGYLECLKMIESQDEVEKKVEKIRILLTMRTNGFLEYSNRTERDIFFLQIKKPELYQKLIGIIQTNRLLLNHNEFDNVQLGFETEWLASWINNIKTTIPELRAVNQEILSLQNSY